MIEKLPLHISIVFIITTLLTLLICYWVIKSSNDKAASNSSIKILLALFGWLALQGLISIKNIYSNDNSLPPKILLFGVIPFLILGIYLFTSNKGKKFIDSLSLEKLTYLNLVRIPVEFVLLWLFLSKAIPQILTFEGWNFDIAMGLTAPFIIYFGYRKRKLSKNLIVIWNIIGILMLGFIFLLAVLSAPYVLQQLAFDQPNIGLLHFPFTWLPTFIVPIVILGHFISIRQLIKKDHIYN